MITDPSMANRPGHCSECGGGGGHADDCSHERVQRAAAQAALGPTAFGPADHPALPLGLRRHPRFAVRCVIDDLMPTFYAHEADEAAVLKRVLQPHVLGFIMVERWDDERKAWVDA